MDVATFTRVVSRPTLIINQTKASVHLNNMP
jgi:hypothetical protein